MNTDGDLSFASSNFLAIPANKKLIDEQYDNIKILKNLGITDVSVKRFINLGESTVQFLLDNRVSRVVIEDYAFAAKGRVFNIGENCGILKMLLYNAGIEYSVIAPSVIKKYATGKGNANKNKMFDSFLNETGINLFSTFGLKETKNLPSPIDDLIDSYYLARYLAEGHI